MGKIVASECKNTQTKLKMDILQLYYKVPFPMHDGGAFAIFSSTQGLLSQNANITLLAMNQKTYPGNISEWSKQQPECSIHWVDIDNRLHLMPALLSIFSKQSYLISRFRSAGFRRKLISVLQAQKFDVIQLEHLYLCLYISDIRKYSNAPVVLRAQNVENILWQQRLAQKINPLKSLFLKIAVLRLKKFEEHVSDRLDGILALSDDDAAFFQKHNHQTPVASVPVGIDIQLYCGDNLTDNLGKTPVFFHLGSMDWWPNEEGLKWFIDHVLPHITANVPGFRFHIAGKKMQRYFFDKANETLIVHDTVSDARSFMSEKDVLIVPLKSGSGIRVKILEAMAMGKTVLTTSAGCKGLQLIHNTNVLIADSPEDFADAIEKCCANPVWCNQIGKNARSWIQQNVSVQSTGKKMMAFYDRLLK